MSHQKKPEHHNRPYKIAAQSVGLAACIFIAVFITGTGIPLTLKNQGNELMPFVPLLLLPVVGYIITWFKEFAGTLLMTAGGIILLIFFTRRGDTNMGLVYGLPFIVAGAVFLVHMYKRIQLKIKREEGLK